MLTFFCCLFEEFSSFAYQTWVKSFCTLFFPLDKLSIKMVICLISNLFYWHSSTKTRRRKMLFRNKWKSFSSFSFFFWFLLFVRHEKMKKMQFDYVGKKRLRVDAFSRIFLLCFEQSSIVSRFYASIATEETFGNEFVPLCFKFQFISVSKNSERVKSWEDENSLARGSLT